VKKARRQSREKTLTVEQKHIPVRTCLGCRAKRPQQELAAFALDGQGRLVFDPARRVAGRHAYCCRNRNCLKAFSKKKRLVARAFRVREIAYDDGELLKSLRE